MLPSAIALGTQPAYAGPALPLRNTPKARSSSDDSDSGTPSFQDHLAEQSKTEDQDKQAKAPEPKQAKAPLPLTQAEAPAQLANVGAPAPLELPRQAEALPPPPATEPRQSKAPAPPRKPSDKQIDLKTALLSEAAPQLVLPVFTSGTAPAQLTKADTNAVVLPKGDVPSPAVRQPGNLTPIASAAGPVTFAVRVNPAPSKDTQPDAQDQDKTAAGPQILLGSREPAIAPAMVSQQQEHKGDGSQDGLPTAMAEAETQKTPQPFSEHLQTADAAKAGEPDRDPKPLPAEPARQIHVQVTGDGNQRVDLRVIQRDGSMSVSVRAADPNLSRTLQEHMPELTTRLEADHFHTETWVPRSNASASSSFEQRNSDSNTGYSPGGNGSGQQQGGQRDDKPEWVDELENYARNSQTRRNSLWRQ